MTSTATLLVSNIHCPSCVSYVQDVLGHIPGVDPSPVVSLIDHTVRVAYNEKTVGHRRIAQVLRDAAFDVRHVTVHDAKGTTVLEYSFDSPNTTSATAWRRTLTSTQRKHLKNCKACQQERAGSKSHRPTWSSLRKALPLMDPSPTSRTVAPPAHSEASVDQPAVINVDGPTDEEKSSSLRGVFSIEGMTCSVCVGTITRGLRELSFVHDVNVDLVSNSGTVEFEGKENVDPILEKIDDLGYDAVLVTLVDLNNTTKETKERTIQIKIDGMYCGHCPERVVQALESLHHNAEPEQRKHVFRVVEKPTFENPIVTITYQPSLDPRLTARQFVSTINASDPALQAYIYHPPTIEERGRRMQHHERLYILRRLTFSGMVAIPTFIIGIVFMDLVSSQNSTRIWFQEPIWSGSVQRAEWALFIMTTPVMFFGSDVFHKRAAREIWSMWKPSSSVPIFRRFYRFGSMNLLISIGTLVAYVSSLAVMILEATTPADTSTQHRSPDTYFDSVTFLTFFILIGRFLEAYSKARTGDAVAMLSKLRPTEALLMENGMQRIPVDQLEVGDVVQIPHGQSPPTDGVVEQDGNFLFDESSLTGESMPAKKSNGSTIYTGTVNVSDPVQIRVTEIGGTSMLDQIIEVVRQGQSKRAPIERLADILTGYFVPVITLLAVLTWLIWMGLGLTGKLPSAWLDVRRGGWEFWSLEFAIAVFVVACPCGLGLAAPTALFVGGGLAAKNGILVQGGGEAFQEASQLRTIVFDKTGTLTQGQMMVTDLEILSTDVKQDVVLAVTKALEQASNHPIARSIVDYCKDTQAHVDSIEVSEVPGRGLKGTFAVKEDDVETRIEAAIGNENMLGDLRTDEENDDISLGSHSSKSIVELKKPDNSQQDYYLRQLLQKYQSQGRSTAILAIRKLQDGNEADASQIPNWTSTAVFAIADPIKPEAPGVLEALRRHGVDVHMCTGDNQTTAHAVASRLGIPVSNVRSSVLPQEKAEYLSSLQHPTADHNSQSPRHIVAFVGDGTNDTPALAAADVSIALSSGSDVAVNSASFILLNSDLNTILTLVGLAKRVFNRVKMNFAWAAVYNVCLIPVAAGVFFAVSANDHHGGWRLGPVWASAAMAASSVSVVMSSLALRLPEMKANFWQRTS